jgi:hypothetical protein
MQSAPQTSASRFASRGLSATAAKNAAFGRDDKVVVGWDERADVSRENGLRSTRYQAALLFISSFQRHGPLRFGADCLGIVVCCGVYTEVPYPQIDLMAR